MAKSIRDIPKKARGRPSKGGRREGILVRWEADQIDALDDWIAKQKALHLTRPEAIRRLVEIGLSKSEAAKRPKVLTIAKQSAARAAELAAKTIDKHIDPDAHPEEREVRKRKLVEGPSVFRDARKDRPGT